MKPFKYLAFLCIGMSLLLITAGGHVMKRSLILHTYILNEEQPSALLQKILAATNINHDGTLQNIVELTQKKQPIGFMRPHGKERWEIPDVHEDKRELLLDAFRQLNALNTLIPAYTHYDYAIIHGASLERVKDRMLFLINQYKQGIRFDSIVVLSGKRIVTDLEKKEVPSAQTEYEMMQVIWNQLLH